MRILSSQKLDVQKKECFNVMELPIVRKTFFEVSMTLKEEIHVITLLFIKTSNLKFNISELYLGFRASLLADEFSSSILL